MSVKKRVKKELKGFKNHLSKRSLRFLTSALALVTALAWNEAIKESVNVYVKPYLGEESGVTSLFIYAILLTVIVLFVTYNLDRFSGKDD